MYLAISAVAAMCAALAAVQTRNAKRLGADLRKKTMEAESFQLASQANEQRLGAEKLVHAQLVERCTKVEQALRVSEDTACELRARLHRAEEALGLRESEYDEVLHALHDAERIETTLRQERRKLNEALNTEREAAEHWKEEFQKEQAYRLSTEGRIMREVNNLLRYDGTAHGQEDLSDE